MHRVSEALVRARFRYVNEVELHGGIAALLNEVGIVVGPGNREVCLSPRDRIDFLLDLGLGIEVKVDGAASGVWRQLRRYAEHDLVRALMLVTTRARHATGAPTSLNGKPIEIHVLRRGLW